jgi:hypothetical protein
VVKVEWDTGELFPRVGFIVTDLKWDSKSVVCFSNRRGTAEQWIKEGKVAVKWTKPSCRWFKDNAARLQLIPRLCPRVRLGCSSKRVREPSPGVRGAGRSAISRSSRRRRAACGDSGVSATAVRRFPRRGNRCSCPNA